MAFPTYETTYVYTKSLINAGKIEIMSARKRAYVVSIVVISKACCACKYCFLLLLFEAY